MVIATNKQPNKLQRLYYNLTSRSVRRRLIRGRDRAWSYLVPLSFLIAALFIAIVTILHVHRRTALVVHDTDHHLQHHAAASSSDEASPHHPHRLGGAAHHGAGGGGGGPIPIPPPLALESDAQHHRGDGRGGGGDGGGGGKFFGSPPKRPRLKKDHDKNAKLERGNDPAHGDGPHHQLRAGHDAADAAKHDVSCGSHRAPSCAQCPRGHGAGWCNGDCIWKNADGCQSRMNGNVHPMYSTLIQQYAFQPVTTDTGEYVNVILVRSPFRSSKEREMFETYQNDILFLGISSFEAFPLSSPNPFSTNFPDDEYTGMFPGFLHMMHHPEKHFPPSVKTILMSQSDFNLEEGLRFNHGQVMPKQYDFTFSGTDQDVANNCVGWSSFAKNWTFVLSALEVMCSDEFALTGVIVASKDKKNVTACTIPPSCHGKIVQTPFLKQNDFFTYLSQSKFAFLPQVYDASPRVSTQALSLDVPMLLNDNILGGWKYLNDQTGESFHDMSDFKEALRRILDGVKNKKYQPRKYVTEWYGTEKAGVKLKDFVVEHFADRVTLPEGTKLLIPSGA